MGVVRRVANHAKRSCVCLTIACAAVPCLLCVEPTTGRAESRTARRHARSEDKLADFPSEARNAAAGAFIGQTARDAGQEVAESLPDNVLPTLPEAPRLEALQPSAEDIQELSAKLNGLFPDEAESSDGAMAELVEVRPQIVAAIRQRLLQLAERADKEKMKRLYADARRETHGKRDSVNTDGTGGFIPNDASVLQTLLRAPHPKDPAWRDCVLLAAMLRMLSASGTVEGARELVTAYAKFGEFIRVEVQQRLSDMKDRALAALIEARRHPAEKVARWAGLRLDQMGRAIPSESVRTDDFEALADILRAYGRVRDPDAARIIVSFANSERTQLRAAARQAIVLLGSVGMWQLRDAYEDVVGRRPRRDWTWERTARELFGEFDRLRLARVYGTYVEGLRHLEKGELELMGRAFDLVLAKDPLFEKRSQMATGYFRLAQFWRDRKPQAAMEALMRVDRLSSDESLAKQARSLTLTLRAMQSTAHGVFDTNRLTYALELDPNNRLARDALAKAQPDSMMSRYASVRWISSAVIALAGLLAVMFVLLRRTKSTTQPAPVPEPDGRQ
jgi:hypothetical protein